jgi:hypothetical protein
MISPEAKVFLESHGIQATSAQLSRYLTEAINTLERVILSPPSKQLSAAELAILSEGGFDVDSIGPTDEDPLARTMADYAGLLATAISTHKAAQVLKRDESRIRQRLAARTLYGIRQGRNWMLPLFQFEVHKYSNRLEPLREVPGIDQVVSRLNPELDPVSVYRWFSTPSDELYDEKNECALSPRDWLLLGYPVDSVTRLAEDA